MNNQKVNINKAQQQLANSLNKIAHYHVQQYANMLKQGIVPPPAVTNAVKQAAVAAEAAGGTQGSNQTAKAANNAAAAAATYKAIMENINRPNWNITTANYTNKMNKLSNVQKQTIKNAAYLKRFQQLKNKATKENLSNSNKNNMNMYLTPNQKKEIQNAI